MSKTATPLRRALWVVVASAALLAAPASARQLTVTDEQHIGQGPHSRFVTRGLPRPLPQLGARAPLPVRPPNPMLGSNLLLEKPERRVRDLDFDAPLSRLCRRGLLQQQQDRLFIARFGGMTYGAALGGHWSLYDPRGQAKAGYLYVVRDQDTTRCRVYRGDFLGFAGTTGSQP